MNKSVFFILAGLALLSLNSCSQLFYQVYEVKSGNWQQEENSLVYENEDCKLMYNLWSEGGMVNFFFVNKTDKEIFVDMTQSFCIVNGQAMDYYRGRVFSTSSMIVTEDLAWFNVDNVSEDGYWSANMYASTHLSVKKMRVHGNKRLEQNSVSTQEPGFICVPPHSYKRICNLTVSPPLKTTCDTKKDFPSHKATVGQYGENETPYQFRNRIAYGFDQNAISEKRIENDFWISSIVNYSRKGATEKVRESDSCYRWKRKHTQYYFKTGGPNKFYNTYTRGSIYY